MLKVNELEKLAASLSAEGFRKQMGPFVLIQRPPGKIGGSDTDQMGLPMNVQSTTIAKPGAVSTGTLALHNVLGALVDEADVIERDGRDWLLLRQRPASGA